MSVLNSIKRDIQAVLDRDPAAKNPVEVVLAYPGFHARQLHRLAHTLERAGVPVLPRVVSNVSRFVTGIEIHPGATIGEGLFIDHGMGVVIGETAEIGDDCNLLQGVTLGGTSTLHKKRHPTLGDRVTVGAGAKLIGAVEIGDDARIGAGSVVVTNVPAERDRRRRSRTRRRLPRPWHRHDHPAPRPGVGPHRRPRAPHRAHGPPHAPAAAEARGAGRGRRRATARPN